MLLLLINKLDLFPIWIFWVEPFDTRQELEISFLPVLSAESVLNGLEFITRVTLQKKEVRRSKSCVTSRHTSPYSILVSKAFKPFRDNCET